MRRLLRSPGFALIAVLTLALGIGASVAIYTVLERVVLDPMPYPHADRLVRVKSPVPGSGTDAEWETSTAEFFYFRQHARSVDAVALYYLDGSIVQTRSGPQRVYVASTTASLLPLVGASAVLGRLFDADDDRPDAPPVAVLSNGFWRRQYGGDRGVVGRTVRLYDRAVTIVGVMAPGIELPAEPGQDFGLNADLWTPKQLDPAGPFFNSHVSQRMLVRLAPGVSLERAQAEFTSFIPRLHDAYPGVYQEEFLKRFGFTAKLYPLKAYVVGDAARNLWIVFGAVAVVLLIAFANVANLFLVRAETRRRDVAVRRALGAGSVAIARHYLAESAVLAGAGGVLGVVIGYWALKWLLSLAPTTLPRLEEVRFGPSVYLFTAAVAFLIAFSMALFPLLRSRRIQGVAALAEGGRGSTAGRERQRARSALVVAQVALALVLVVGAALLIESFRRLRAVDPGFRADGAVTMQLDVSPARHHRDELWGFYRSVLERVRALPGVTAAGLSEGLPLGGSGCTIQGFEDARVLARLADSDQTTCAGQVSTSPGYFEALGIPLQKGRTFEASDDDDPGVGSVVVSKRFADRFWPGEDAIGKGVAPNGMKGPYYHVVGVVGDVPAESLDGDAAIAIYYPIQAIPPTHAWWPYHVNLVLHATGVRPLSLVPAIRRAVQEVDPTVPVSNPDEMQAIVDRSMSRLSFTMVLLGLAGGVALFLAAIGLYGVISYLVARRTGEIGLRMALGAQPRQVLAMIVTGSARLAGVGLAVGLVISLFASRLLRGLLYGVAPTSPLAYAVAALVLGGVALLASWLPAHRAARIDPAEALRTE